MVPHLSQLAEEGDRAADKARQGVQYCGNWLLFRHFTRVDKVRLAGARFCKQHLICPLCAIRRGGRLLKQYMDKLPHVRAAHPGCVLFHVVFTVKNGPDLEERHRHLARGLRVIMKRRYQPRVRSTLKPMIGGVWSQEVTFNADTEEWHPHAHMAAVFPAGTDPAELEAALQAEWLAVTGDSFMVKVVPFYEHQDPAEAFCEVFKYAVKFTGLGTRLRWIAARTLARKRLIGSCGAFRLSCPESLLDDPDLDPNVEPFVDYLFRYVGGRYGLALIDSRADNEPVSQSLTQ